MNSGNKMSGNNILLVKGEEFYKLALEASRTLRGKYFTVARYHEPEDVVQELARKIVDNDTQYDESRNFRSFIYTMVSNMYVDLGRSKDIKYKDMISLNETVSTGKYRDSAEKLLQDTLVYDGPSVEEEIDGLSTYEYIIENLPCESNRMAETPLGVMRYSIRNIILLKEAGYSSKEIAGWFDVNTSSVNNQLSKGKEIILNLI